MTGRHYGKLKPYRLALMVLLFITTSLILFPSLLFADNYPDTDLTVSLDRENRVLKGIARTIFSGEGDRKLNVGDLTITSVKLNGERIQPRIMDGIITLPSSVSAEARIEFERSCTERGPCTISDTGLFLTGTWHPAPHGLSRFRLRATLPSVWTVVSEAEQTSVQNDGAFNVSTFEFTHPRESVSLVAAAFTVKKEQVAGVTVSLFSLPDNIASAAEQMKQTELFLRMHTDTLGPFPYQSLSVVVSPFASSFSAPTIILIGETPLPARAESTLGREILRQWLGKSVYANREKGNWSEGLATYMHNHRLAEQDNRDWEYRKQLLVNYGNHVSPDKETSLRDFWAITDPASEAVGSGKGAMVIHMLKRLVGNETFFRSLRSFAQEKRFTTASWDDIRAVFEKESGMQLGQFFEQWVSGRGAPEIAVRNRDIRITGTGSLLLCEVSATDGDRQYVLDLPASINTVSGEINRVIKVSGEKSRVEIATEGDPEILTLDRDYDLFRDLQEDEVPLQIGRLFSKDKGILVLPDESDRIPLYSSIIDFFTARGYVVREWKDIKDAELRKSPTLLIGHDNPALRRLFGKILDPAAGFLLTVKRNPLNSLQVIAIADTDSAKAAEAAAAELWRYYPYSTLRLTPGSAAAETIVAESRRGWNFQLREPVTGIEVPKSVLLSDAVERFASRKIIFIGELHEKYQHHRVQLELIRALWKRNQEIVIGMEMFRRPFQKQLDDFISGTVNEKEFLRSSEYFKQWGFDYALYRDILRFARDKKIPVIALNTRKDLTGKVSKGGIDSLTDEEKRDLPENMDMTDDDYKNRLREVFGQHGSSEGRNFDNFYQSQIIWDEIMAQSIDEYLQKNPGRQMIVLAGAGHLMYSSGIPKRSFRRNQNDYAVILNDETAEPGIADFIFYPKEAEYQPAPKLMALLKEEEGKVKIIGFPEQSVSEKAGLQKGDIIISLDGEKVTSVQDIQIFLYDKRKGDSIALRVMRNRFIFGRYDIELKVTL